MEATMLPMTAAAAASRHTTASTCAAVMGLRMDDCRLPIGLAARAAPGSQPALGAFCRPSSVFCLLPVTSWLVPSRPASRSSTP